MNEKLMQGRRPLRKWEPSKLGVGSKVLRGPPDGPVRGGEPQKGEIIAVAANGAVKVRWEDGTEKALHPGRARRLVEDPDG